MPYLTSVRYCVGEGETADSHKIVVVRYLFSRDEKLSPGAMTMLKVGVALVCIPFAELNGSSRVQWSPTQRWLRYACYLVCIDTCTTILTRLGAPLKHT